MSPRIAFWTSAFEPEMEAVASEVAVLRNQFPSSVVWGMNPNYWLRLSRRRGFCLNPSLHLLFRAATRVLEPAFQLNHIFGSLGDWFYLQARRKRPTVLTVATQSPPVEKRLLDRVDRFVVEVPTARAELEEIGIVPERIRVVYPPVDLTRFAPSPRPSGPFTVLFASSPDREDWLAARGVPQLLDAATLRPQMRFKLLWRPWGNSESRVRQWITERGLRNVEVISGRVSNMAEQYRGAHLTVVPFTDPTRCKPAPNSLIESLACGRPVLITKTVGLADMINDGDAGLVSAATGESLAENLDRLQSDWERMSLQAVRLAQESFGINKFTAGYRQIYEELIRN